MNEPAIVTGRSYAYREKRLAGTPILRVKALSKLGRRGKLKVRFEDGPYPGLEDYAATRQIICPWNERRAVLRDEQHETQLSAHMREVQDHTLGAAVDAVMQATGELGGGCEAGGTVMRADELHASRFAPVSIANQPSCTPSRIRTVKATCTSRLTASSNSPARSPKPSRRP
jgi:hypothetical protein